MNNQALFNFLLRIGDTNLILAQRLSEWTGHGPFLEEDLALTNIALDLFGTSRSVLEYAAKIEEKGRTEDDLAFLRGEREFVNPLICELPNGDYAFTIARQCIVDAFQLHFYSELVKSKDETIAGISAKAIKETKYHFRHSASWMERFGNGTEESHERLQNALNFIWAYTEDVFATDAGYNELIKTGIVPEMAAIKSAWEKSMNEVLAKSSVSKPENVFMQKGSLKGIHTEQFGYLLTEMQYMQRAFPGAKW
ncbi:MAG: phenylacetate-CoA oxygenase subunit PaaC [Bacteroidia bacterium]|nr:phenylacetate-CoA oxygenase subunit PaaC [Bacteroidia bacterium]